MKYINNRLLKTNETLWEGYLELELEYLALVSRRVQNLGLQNASLQENESKEESISIDETPKSKEESSAVSKVANQTSEMSKLGFTLDSPFFKGFIFRPNYSFPF